MRVMLLQARPGEDPCGLEALLRQWAARPDSAGSLLTIRPVSTDLPAELQMQQTEVVVLTDTLGLAPDWEVDLGRFPCAIVAAVGKAPGPFRAVAEQHPVVLIPAPPSPEGLHLALVSAEAALVRHRAARCQVEQLQQRLSDRIVIERAKGILVQRLGISEEEAYKRLRVLSRRQRRQIREIAQSLLDTESLLLPEANGFLDHLRTAETPPHPAGASEQTREPDPP